MGDTHEIHFKIREINNQQIRPQNQRFNESENPGERNHTKFKGLHCIDEKM